MTPAAIKHLSRADAVLGKLIKKIGPCGLEPKFKRSPFEALVQSVAYQQLNGTAAATILGRVKKLYPGRRFPSPQQILDTADEALRGAGLSRSKIAAIKDIAAKTLSGHIPTLKAASTMTDAEIVNRLTEVRGVGPWTAEMFLIFTLGRPDVFPITDYGVRKGFALTYGWKELPTPKELLEAGEKWRPHRTTAAWYFWRALDNPAGRA
jgi:DNA-3-methyladenine glycosylase II